MVSLCTPFPYNRAKKTGAKAASIPAPTLPAPASTMALGLACPLAELAVVAAAPELVTGVKPLGAATPDGTAGAAPVG